MSKAFAVDTNCIVAAVCNWHVHHRLATRALDVRLGRGEAMVVPLHALSEAYSVITRMPAPYRVGPAEAWDALDLNFVQPARVITLTVRQHIAFLARTASSSVAGGRVYDALIAECAMTAGATTLLTFNSSHFNPAPAGLAVVVPA